MGKKKCKDNCNYTKNSQIMKGLCLDLQKIKNYLGEIYGVSGFTIRPILLRPKSRGFLTLRSKDPRDAPLVDIGYLQHPDDVATLVDGEPKRRDGVRGGHIRCRGGDAGVKWVLGEDEEGILKGCSEGIFFIVLSTLRYCVIDM